MNAELIKVMVGAGFGLFASMLAVVHDYSKHGLLLDPKGYPSLLRTFMRDSAVITATTLGMAGFGVVL